MSEILKLHNPQDPTEVAAELKKHGIASIDDLVKKTIELSKQSQLPNLAVFKGPWGVFVS